MYLWLSMSPQPKRVFAFEIPVQGCREIGTLHSVVARFQGCSTCHRPQDARMPVQPESECRREASALAVCSTVTIPAWLQLCALLAQCAKWKSRADGARCVHAGTRSLSPDRSQRCCAIYCVALRGTPTLPVVVASSPSVASHDRPDGLVHLLQHVLAAGALRQLGSLESQTLCIDA